MFWSFHLIFLPNVNGPFPRTAVMATSNSTRLLRYTCCHLILYFIRHQGVSPRGSHYPSDPHLNSAAAKIPHKLPTYRHQMYPDAFSSWSNSYKNKLLFFALVLHQVCLSHDQQWVRTYFNNKYTDNHKSMWQRTMSLYRTIFESSLKVSQNTLHLDYKVYWYGVAPCIVMVNPTPHTREQHHRKLPSSWYLLHLIPSKCPKYNPYKKHSPRIKQ